MSSSTATTQHNIETGRQGGHVDTNGMSASDKARTDAEVRKGREDARR